MVGLKNGWMGGWMDREKGRRMVVLTMKGR